MRKYPHAMSDWKKRAQWIVTGFGNLSKRAHAQLADFLEVCNGDTAQEVIVHCCQGCCSTTEETIDKVIRLIVPLLSRGFQVPLLYRFKVQALRQRFEFCQGSWLLLFIAPTHSFSDAG